jgi:large subunit ribosomal protein L9
MKVILTESYMSLGEAGEAVEVRSGYARNFLIPQKIAVSATLANLKKYEDKAKELNAKREKERDNSKKTLSTIEKLSITLKKKTSDEGKLFGSVTTKEIEEAFKQQGATVDRRQIVISKQVKMIGDYSILVKLVGGLKATIPLKIVPETPLKSASAALTESLMADNDRLNKRDAIEKERQAKFAADFPEQAAAQAAAAEAAILGAGVDHDEEEQTAKKKGGKKKKK